MSSDALVPELQGDVHGVGSLVSGKLDEALLVLEGHRHRHEVEGAALHHSADVLCSDRKFDMRRFNQTNGTTLCGAAEKSERKRCDGTLFNKLISRKKYNANAPSF